MTSTLAPCSCSPRCPACGHALPGNVDRGVVVVCLSTVGLGVRRRRPQGRGYRQRQRRTPASVASRSPRLREPGSSGEPAVRGSFLEPRIQPLEPRADLRLCRPRERQRGRYGPAHGAIGPHRRERELGFVPAGLVRRSGCSANPRLDAAVVPRGPTGVPARPRNRAGPLFLDVDVHSERAAGRRQRAVRRPNRPR